MRTIGWVPAEMTIDTLVRFSRMAAGAGAPEDILSFLVEAAVERVHVEGAAALRLAPDGRFRVAAARGCGAAQVGWQSEADTMGPELSAEIQAWCASGHHAFLLPLVSSSDLFGVLVLMGAPDLFDDPAQMALANGLADLAAVSLGKTQQLDELRRSYTELRASREVLARTEKIRALGQLAAGVSHDLKNILNPLSLQLQVLKRKLGRDPAAAAEAAGRMEEEIRHGIDVVERLRAFSRQAPETSEVVDLERLASTALELGRSRLDLHSRVEVVEALAPAPPVQARASELVTAVVNLVFNALEALPESGGRIEIRTGGADDGGWIEVADNGPGMAPEVAHQVFEPFFTTKREGTGLGLAMVDAFIRRHGGKVTLDTAPGRGTRVRLWFPPPAQL